MITTPLPSSRRARAARREARRQRKLTAFFVVVGALVVAAAFVGGYGWQSGRWSESSVDGGPSVAADDTRRVQALEMLDEAVRANYEERPQGVANALQAARELDASLPGVDAFVAEMALTSGDAHTLRQAAQVSLRKRERVAAANLLLALEKWMNRGQGADSVVAGDVAKQYLEDAVQSEPSNGAVYFFWGEMSRMAGDHAAAQRQLLGGLYREMPWRSSGILATKQQFADNEARALGRSTSAPLPRGNTALAADLHQRAQHGGETANLRAELLAQSALGVVRHTFDDRALRSTGEFAGYAAELGKNLGPSLSHHSLPNP